MTEEQKELLQAWCNNLLVTYRLDYFRGIVLIKVVGYLCDGVLPRLDRTISICQEANSLGAEVGAKSYAELLGKLSQIEKVVPLSDAAHLAIACVFGGEWEEAIESLDKLKSERNEQN